MAASIAPERSSARRGGGWRRLSVKPTKQAPLICTLATISAAIGILLGILTGGPMWIVVLMVPAVVYEIYRTAGASTKWASWAMLGLLVAISILILFGISFDVAGFLGQESTEVAGQHVPLGDIQMLGPVLLAVVAVILAIRTAGIYTRWLAAIIFVSAFALIYVLNPEIFTDLLRTTVQQGIDSV
jgi:hypothetical protein